MSANKFVLKHGKIKVEYTKGITPGLPALTYKNGSEVKKFEYKEITTNDTTLGSLVSVRLSDMIDTGENEFGFFLPELDVSSGQTEKFTTVGIYSGTFHKPPHHKCTSIEFHGTAQNIIIPL